LTNYSRAKEMIEKILKELKDNGIKVKSPLSKTQDYHCEAEFSVNFDSGIPSVDASFTFNNIPKDEEILKIEAVMSTYNSYLDSIYFEKDYTKLEFRVR
jgi:hypothetical protein